MKLLGEVHGGTRTKQCREMWSVITDIWILSLLLSPPPWPSSQQSAATRTLQRVCILSAPAESSNRAPVAAALLGRGKHRLQFARYLPQGESARQLLLHHADRGLLGAVRHYFVVLVAQAEGERAGPLVAVDMRRDGEPAKSIQDRGTARGGNP